MPLRWICTRWFWYHYTKKESLTALFVTAIAFPVTKHAWFDEPILFLKWQTLQLRLVKAFHSIEHWKFKSSEHWSWPTVEASFQLKIGSSNTVHIDSDQWLRLHITNINNLHQFNYKQYPCSQIHRFRYCYHKNSCVLKFKILGTNKGLKE